MLYKKSIYEPLMLCAIFKKRIFFYKVSRTCLLYREVNHSWGKLGELNHIPLNPSKNSLDFTSNAYWWPIDEIYVCWRIGNWFSTLHCVCESLLALLEYLSHYV